MDGNVSNKTQNPRPPEPLRDALDTWDAEANGHAAPALAALRLDGNERLVIPFTTQMQRVLLHFLETPALTGYVHCNGGGCVLCRIGKKVEERDLLPVYDAEEQVVS